MTRKITLLSVLAASAAATIAANPASAQSFGFSVGPNDPPPVYYQPRYGYGYDYDRRAAWAERERWEDRRRWEAQEARRRYWDERREHRWREHDEEEEDR